MAGSIIVTQAFAATNGSLSVSRSVKQTVVQSGQDFCAQTMLCTSATTATLITIPSTVNPLGWSWFRNLDSTNTILVGHREDEYAGSFFAFMSLAPGESGLMPLFHDTDYAAKTTGGTATLEYIILER